MCFQKYLWYGRYWVKFISLIELDIIIRMIKSRRMRWAGHVAQMRGEEEYM
jgi:hypothetical protein